MIPFIKPLGLFLLLNFLGSFSLKYLLIGVWIDEHILNWKPQIYELASKL